MPLFLPGIWLKYRIIHKSNYLQNNQFARCKLMRKSLLITMLTGCFLPLTNSYGRNAYSLIWIFTGADKAARTNRIFALALLPATTMNPTTHGLPA
jgi:hypothetical protein